MMNEHFEGQLTFIKGLPTSMMLVPAMVCKRNSKTACNHIEFQVDTGADKSILSYTAGNQIGLEPPKPSDERHKVYDAQNNPMEYILRDVKIYIQKDIVVEMKIPWCTSVLFTRNMLGMDFFKRHKLILIGGKINKFYITKIENCVLCRKHE